MGIQAIEAPAAPRHILVLPNVVWRSDQEVSTIKLLSASYWCRLLAWFGSLWAPLDLLHMIHAEGASTIRGLNSCEGQGPRQLQGQRQQREEDHLQAVQGVLATLPSRQLPSGV